jgi:TonB family protein
MNRLEKKCTITSAVLHGLLLLVILVAGLGFFQSDAKVLDPTKVITLINPSDLPGAGGGNPAATPTPPPPPADKPVDPTPPTPPTPVDPPQVKKEELKTPDPIKPKDPVKPPVKDSAVTPTPPKHVVKVSTNPVKRPATDAAAAQAQKERAARADADARLRAQRTALAAAFRGSANTLGKNLSQATTIEPFGPGGEAYANYGLIVRDIYDRAWLVSDALGDEDSTVKVSVLIARDGTVLSARIIKSSGVPALDKSVQKTLNDVKSIVPFPEGAKDHERRFDINFNLKAKRLSA